MKDVKVAFRDSNRFLDPEEGRSLANTHFSFSQPSSFVELRDGSLKRRRQKLSYKDIYLERQDYKQVSLRNSSMKLFSHSNGHSSPSLRLSNTNQSKQVTKRGHQEPPLVSIEKDLNKKVNSKTKQNDILSIKTKQEREYKRRREKEKIEEEMVKSTTKLITGEIQDESQAPYIKQGSSTKKIGTKYQERVQYINFNDFLIKEEAKASMKEDHKDSSLQRNRQHQQNDRYDYHLLNCDSNHKNISKEKNEIEGTNEEAKEQQQNEGHQERRNSRCLKQNEPKSIQNINVIPNSINENYFHQRSKPSTGNDKEIFNDEVNQKTNSKLGVNLKKTNQAKKKNEHLVDYTRSNESDKQPQRQPSSEKIKEKFSSKWQRAIAANSIVKNNSNDFFSYVYKAKGSLMSSLGDKSKLLTLLQSNLIKDKAIKEEATKPQLKEDVRQEDQRDQNRAANALRNSQSKIKRRQSKDELDDMKLVNMMKISNVAASCDYLALNSEKENPPTSKLSNYSHFLTKKPIISRSGSAFNIHQKGTPMQLNDKEPEVNGFNSLKANIKVGNKNISTIQKEKEANEDSYAHEHKKPNDSLGDLLMEGRTNTARNGECHCSNHRRGKDNSNMKRDNSFNESIFKSVNQFTDNLHQHNENDKVSGLNQQPRTERFSPNDNLAYSQNEVNVNRNAIHQKKSIIKTMRHSGSNWKDQMTSLKKPQMIHSIQINNSFKGSHQLEEVSPDERYPIKNYKPISQVNDCNKALRFVNEGIVQHGSFPIKPYPNDHFNLSSSTVLNPQRNSANAVPHITSLARSLSQGALLSITEQFILNNRISLSPKSTIRKDIFKNTLIRQTSTFYIDKVKQDLREYTSSKEKKRLKRDQQYKNEDSQKKRKENGGGVMPPNSINEIEYCYV